MNNIPISVRFADEFERRLYRLSKKYRSIRQDVEPILEQLQQKILLGDRLSGFGSNLYVYKVRAKNSNIQKGKSGGYRIIYLLESETSILLLTIYSKSEQEDMTTEQIQTILEELSQSE
ncbi:type II toxin-antitoxin system RelE/ParE family toxin [Laspinema olomoucense]|uniref:type II toxin-antitoxin system RelE/ParE family toxin n=1 Tax=Laspinema olomoucense TaxID=3231600 RepID=UPI0021BAAB08|nr:MULTISPECIES: type II toxin-antitoxin system RelE/ParE family toxin [unclassified Laspinema]MCT7971949.1 type II toxin-antitoxin system RelE/ParE family toxin [Laspinema sp. D3d]MCT7994595.1 type II toxin-antitoxin system RelE/ParE family toxin [Laspinema sp. D3c]